MGWLVLFFVLKSFFVNLFPVSLQFTISSFWLEKKIKLDVNIHGKHQNYPIIKSTAMHHPMALLISHLEDFDLTAGGVNGLQVFPVLVSAEGVHLYTKRDSLLPPMLPGSEFSADAVNLCGGEIKRE